MIRDMRAARLAMIDQATLIITQHPLTGVGLGGYNKAAQTAIPTYFAELLPAFRATLLKGVVHNKYLLTFAELGVIGLILFLLFLLALVWFPFAKLQWKSSFQYALTLGLSGSVVGQIVFYMFDHFSYDIRLSMLYVTAGLLVASRAAAIPTASAIGQKNERVASFATLGAVRSRTSRRRPSRREPPLDPQVAAASIIFCQSHRP